MSTNSQRRRARLQQKKKADADELAFLDKCIQEAKETTPTPTSTPNPETKDGFVVPRKKIIEKAEEMWKTLKGYSKTNPEFKALSENDKLDYFRSNLGYGTFMDEFPIVSRYMIVHGQYSTKAFDRMLDKVEKAVHPPPQERAKGYMEDQWVMRQADYVQYLWEAYQKRHYNTAERNWVWQSTYQRLKGEFDDFRNMHKDIEAKVKEEKMFNAGQNARELLERLATGSQKLTAEEEEFLLYELQGLAYKKTFNDCLSELTSKVKLIEPSAEGTGSGPEHVPKVTMIETVDANRMNEIDDKYKPVELRGMEAVPEEPEEEYDEVVAEIAVDEE